ncbi:MAG: DNA primase [Treponema sp.]|jgi:DNA primase|nr:DNA primase [Treponema sp.]
MALISKTTIQEVNNRLDAISVVGEYVSLEKKGGRWWGRCPFHAGGQEKTPSFKVDPDLKMYHCFGCSKGGSVISFIMEMEKISYPEAIKSLARKIGIEIIYEEGGAQEEQDTSQKEELYELYRRTTVTFTHFLLEKQEGSSALNYIKSRGFSREMIDRFKLGFSSPDRDFLHKFLISKGYSDAFLEKSGLFSSRYKNLPLFTGRLMFPIADRQGRISAFGGRALPGVLQSDGKEPPKYINSPETEIYKKGQTLYALDLALPAIRQTKTVYLAEGYMDVIALHQAEVTNAVAPLGTAFTEDQAALLRRWADKIVLVFDTDSAGEKAAYKAIITCRKNALSCEICQIRRGLKEEIPQSATEKFKDPADILQEFGPKILNKVVNCTINDFEYLVSHSRLQYKAEDGGINRAAEFMFPYLDALDTEVERDNGISLVADAFRIERNAVQDDYHRWKKEGRSRQFQERSKQTDVLQDKPVKSNVELSLLTAVALNMTLYQEFRTALEIKEIDDPSAKELFVAMEECYIHEESGIDSLLARIKNEQLKKFIAERGASAEFNSGYARRLMEDGIKKIKIKKLRKRVVEIGAEMRDSERSGAEINLDELLAEKKSIDSQIRKLEGR